MSNLPKTELDKKIENRLINCTIHSVEMFSMLKEMAFRLEARHPEDEKLVDHAINLIQKIEGEK